MKKNNIITANLTDKAIVALQLMGYLHRNKKVNRQKNLSEFISTLVINHIGINFPKETRVIEEKLLISQLWTKQQERNELDDEIKLLAQRLRTIQDSNKNYQQDADLSEFLSQLKEADQIE